MYIEIYTIINLVRGDDVQIYRDMALFALGATSVVMYQKYKEPVMKKVECATHTMLKKADEVLDDMM